MNDTEEFLAHYGIRGMKWGHRKAEETGDPNGPRTVKMTSKLAVNILRNKVPDLTNPKKARRAAVTHLAGRGVQVAALTAAGAYFVDRGYGSLKLANMDKTRKIAMRQAANAFINRKSVANYPVVHLVKDAAGAWG